MTTHPLPLQGRTIAVTRAEQQLGEARRLFAQVGPGCSTCRPW
jgi:hypothetical protein